MVLKLITSLRTKQQNNPIPPKIGPMDRDYFAFYEWRLRPKKTNCFPLCFMFFPLSYSHGYLNRRWVLQQLIQETSLPSFMMKGNLGTIPAERTQRLIREELEVCGEAAGRYPSNYNAWSHRIWVLQHLAKLDVKVRPLFISLGNSLSALSVFW